ncbi:hypothetical protein Focb16_v006293 [Fusarium oxysporum f. sp. cubense]|uniref:Xylanolytic transcriptional activator regulatory domain-containing protein n=1 Tax=Fusarium oxysporum f. sp. cubense TaxID=61366 RepID=A0A559LQF0_FUSOC|nr:hypothetical protein Focb16_v006293 [Fusarium oxysporum f. sp. cubense]
MEGRLEKMEILLRENSLASEPSKKDCGERPRTSSTPSAERSLDNELAALMPFGSIYAFIDRVKTLKQGNISAPSDSPSNSLVLDSATLAHAANSLPELLQEIPIMDFEDFTRSVIQDRANGRLTSAEDHALLAIRCVAVAIVALDKLANSSYQDMACSGWFSFKNAYQLFPRLFLGTLSLHTVQALGLMAYCAGFSADAKLTSLLLANAIRTCQLFESPPNPVPLGLAIYARKALWAAFVADTELSLHTNLAPSRSGRDLATLGLPSTVVAENLR